LLLKGKKQLNYFGIRLLKVCDVSFQLKGSASAEEATKVCRGYQNCQELAPHYEIDALRYNLCGIRCICSKTKNHLILKCWTSGLLFVFPNYNQGKYRLYKLPKPFRNCEAIGPILQGLNKTHF